MNERRYDRRFQGLFPATLVSLAFVAALGGGCSQEPSAQMPPSVTTTDEPASNVAPLGSDNDIREADPLPPPGSEARPASDTADVAAAPPSFTQAQLESMVAPIALYPDPLLMEILMAATYPAEVVQAAGWVKDHPGLNGKELDDAIADQRWDVSVNSLTHAPDALKLMAADPKWMQDLGDAFLAQQDDVLNAVQVMRLKACDLGNLKTNAQQKVTIEPRPAATAPAPDYVVQPPPRVVRIEPVQPDVVYVPTYNPQVIYGPPPPVYYYPGIYAYPPFAAVVTPVITFGVGLAIGGFLWGDLDWHYHRVYARPYYRDRYIGRWYWNGRYGGYDDFYSAGFARDYYWRHDLDHRRGVRYVNRDVERFYSVRGRDPYRYHDNDYRYDRRKAARGDYNRMPGFDGRGDARGDFRDGRSGDGRAGSGDWREKAREDAREKMQRDSQRGDRGPGGGDRGKDGRPSKDGDRGGKDSQIDRGGDKKGGPGDRGGKGSSMERGDKKGGPGDRGGKGSMDRGGDKKGGPGDRGGKGSSMERGGGKGGAPDRGGKGGGGKVDRPSGGGRPSGGDRGGSKGGSMQRGGGSSHGGSMQRGGGSHGGSSKGGSMQRGGGGGGGGHSMQRGGGSGHGGGSAQRGGGGGGGGRSGGGGSKGGGGGGGERGKGGGKH